MRRANIDHLNQEMPTRKKRMFLFITTTWTVGERSKDSETESFLCRYRFWENEKKFFSTLWWEKAPHRRKGSRKAFNIFYYRKPLLFIVTFLRNDCFVLISGHKVATVVFSLRSRSKGHKNYVIKSYGIPIHVAE